MAVVAPRIRTKPLQVATDIDSKNGPMTILARNVAQNCGRAAETQATADYVPSLRHSVGQGSGGRERDFKPRAKESQTLSETHNASPPRVQSLRWGDRVQLAEALARFDGFAPDVVLA